jgi:nicotinamidase-related amidase
MKRALLVIDVQNEYFSGKLPVTYPYGSLDNIIKAMDAAERNEIPIILIQHISAQNNSATFVKGSNEWDLHESILRRKFNYLVEKNFPGSFTDTELENILKTNEIDTVVICGYMTQMCCDTTSRQAFHLGYSVEFLSDATGTLAISNYAGRVTAEELHKAILVTQAMKFSKVVTTEEWMHIVDKER